MSVHTNDELLKKIAKDYAQRYGQELANEAAYLEQFPGVTISEINVDKRVRKHIAAGKRKRYMPMIATLAACFVIAFIFIVPNMIDSDFTLFNIGDGFAPAPAAEPEPAPAAPAEEAPAPQEPEEDAADMDFVEEAPAPEFPADAHETPPTEDLPIMMAPEQPPPPPPTYAVIPLAVSLPDGFTQVDFDQDRGKSIYFIEDRYRDNVVLTLERVDMPSDMSNLVEINLGGLIAFGKQTDSYSLLTFSRDDVLYTLTSRYDINTLIRLGVAFV